MSIFSGSTLTLHRISFFLLSLGFNKCYKKLTTTTFIRFLSKHEINYKNTEMPYGHCSLNLS